MMTEFLTLIIFATAILSVIIVLLQPTKSSGGLGGLGGAGGGDSVLGTNRNDVLSKATWWLMAVFVISCLSLTVIKTNDLEQEKDKSAEKSVYELENKAPEKQKEVIESQEEPKTK